MEINKFDKLDAILNLSNTKGSPKRLEKLDKFLAKDVSAMSAGDYVSLLDELFVDYKSYQFEPDISYKGMTVMMDCLKGLRDNVQGFIANGLPVSVRMKLVAEMTNSTAISHVQGYGVSHLRKHG